jgi:hypothetical protein
MSAALRGRKTVPPSTILAVKRIKAAREPVIERSDDPEIREKVEVVLDACDSALESALDMVKATERMLTKYAIYDDTFRRNLNDIRRIRYALSKLVAFRATLDKQLYVSKFAMGKLGAEIEKLGSRFRP